MPPKTKPHFFGFPRELRDAIYNEIGVEYRRVKLAGDDEHLICIAHVPNYDVLLVCRQFKNEYLDVVQRKTRLRFEDYLSMPIEFLKPAIPDKVRPWPKIKISKLQFCLYVSSTALDFVDHHFERHRKRIDYIRARMPNPGDITVNLHIGQENMNDHTLDLINANEHIFTGAAGVVEMRLSVVEFPDMISDWNYMKQWPVIARWLVNGPNVSRIVRTPKLEAQKAYALVLSRFDPFEL